METPVIKVFESILRIVSGVTFIEALDLLNRFNPHYANGVVYWNCPTAQELKFHELADDFLLMPLANVGEIWFYGGPPGQEDWICGPAMQYVADCLMKEVTLNGSYYVSKVMYSLIVVGAP